MKDSTDGPKKSKSLFLVKCFGLSSDLSLFSADIPSIFVKFGDNVGSIMYPKNVSRIFDFFFLS